MSLKALLCSLLIVGIANGQPTPKLQFSSVNAGLQLWGPSETASFNKIKMLAKEENDFTPIDLSEYHEGFITINGSNKNGVPFTIPNDKVNTAGALKGMRFFTQLGFVPYSQYFGNKLSRNSTCCDALIKKLLYFFAIQVNS